MFPDPQYLLLTDVAGLAENADRHGRLTLQQPLWALILPCC